MDMKKAFSTVQEPLQGNLGENGNLLMIDQEAPVPPVAARRRACAAALLAAMRAS